MCVCVSVRVCVRVCVCVGLVSRCLITMSHAAYTEQGSVTLVGGTHRQYSWLNRDVPKLRQFLSCNVLSRVLHRVAKNCVSGRHGQRMSTTQSMCWPVGYSRVGQKEYIQKVGLKCRPSLACYWPATLSSLSSLAV